MVLGAMCGVACFPPASVAQETRTVEGTVRSAADASPLAGVRVLVVETGSRTDTDADGRFTLTQVPTVTVRLVFERLGVVTDTVAVEPGVRSITVRLQSQAVLVSPLVTEGALPARERFETLAQTSTVSLDPIDITNTPTLAEPDVARVAQLLPGTVAKNDYSVGINVRGGESDQNLIRLDGITVFNPFHLGGLFSTFDASAVDRVDLITGGFPAGYGGRLSSVLDVGLRRGDRTRLRVNGGVSLLASRLLFEGPIGHTGATFMIGGRRTYADLIARAFSQNAFGYYFGDGVAKLTVPTGHGRISATGYWGRDALDLPWVQPEPGRDGVDLLFTWGNRLAGITWSQPLGAVEWVSHLDVSEFHTRFGLVPDQLDARNAVRHLTASTELGFRVAGVNDVRIGAGVEDDRISYDFSNADFNLELPDGVTINGHRVPYDFGSAVLSTQELDLSYRPRTWFAYLDDQWRPFSGVLLRPGVRVEYVGGGAEFTGVSPRASAKVFVTGNVALTGSVGRYYQALHSIRDQEIPINLFDFWIGADSATPVARSDHLVLGVERWFGRDVSLNVEGYSKTFDDIPIRNLEDDPRVRGDEFKIANGSAWGFDVLLRRHVGKIRGWIAYSYVKTTRTADGVTFPPAHDRRHTVNVVVEAPGPFGGALSVHWGYGSGLPYTGIVGEWEHREYNAELNLFELVREEVVSTTMNGERFPYYSRLDASLRWRVEWAGGLWQPYLNVVNLYNRQNVFAYQFDYASVPATRSGWTQLPLLPTVGVEFQW